MNIHRLTPSEVVPDFSWLQHGSFFSSPGFLNLWTTVGGRPVYLAAEQDSRIAACLPAVEFGWRGLRRLQAMPNDCYARLLCDPDFEDQRSSLARMVLEYLMTAPYVKVYVTDYYHDFPESHGFRTVERRTSLVDVSDPEWEPPDRKARQQIRKAVKEGRAVCPFDRTKHMDGFLRLVRTSAVRTGQSVRYSADFYEELARLADIDARIQWVWMEHDEQAVASSIFLVEGDQLLHWQVHFDQSLSNLQPNKLIPYLAAKEWAAKGVRFLNLGASPAGVPGVAEYKRKWGGQAYGYRCLCLSHGLGRWW